MVLWRPTIPSRTNTPKICHFHYRGLECKSRKSRNTWSNRQIWPWSTGRNRAKANRVLPRECTGHSKPSLPQHETTLHINITRWSILKSDWLYSLWSKVEKLYTVSKNKAGSYCGSDHELLIAKFRLKLKKVGKTLDHSGMTKRKSLRIIQWKWEIDHWYHVGLLLTFGHWTIIVSILVYIYILIHFWNYIGRADS